MHCLHSPDHHSRHLHCTRHQGLHQSSRGCTASILRITILVIFIVLVIKVFIKALEDALPPFSGSPFSSSSLYSSSRSSSKLSRMHCLHSPDHHSRHLHCTRHQGL